MTRVMTSTPLEDLRHSPTEDKPFYQIFPEPADFELRDRLPSIVLEPTEEEEVESGELRWPPEDFTVSEEEREEEGEVAKSEAGQPAQNSER